MKYRREIDGLRAIAVLPVILFHAGFSIFSGGYVGVDVFFVISGYLITGILIGELEQGRFSIIRFYERRARRILPALFVVMLACLPFAYMWMFPTQLKDFAQSLIATIFFSSNILFWRESGYFAAAAELKPLLHTWSLAVEEQYYVIFPLFLLLFWRFGRRFVFLTVLLIALLSLLLAEWGWRQDPVANFYLAPTRAWELLAGSICAFLSFGKAQGSNNLLSATGLALIVFAVFAYDANTPFPSLYALVPVVGTSLIILFAAPGTWVARLLSMRGFVGLGLISYSAYLWHQPLFAFARLHSTHEPGHGLMGALAVGTLLLAWATWHYVEQPFRKRPDPWLATRKNLFLASGAGAAFFVAAGLAGHIGQGLEWRFTPAQVAMIESTSSSPMRDRCHFGINSSFTPEESCTYFDGPPRVAVYGDSHGVELAYGIAEKLRGTGSSVLHMTVSGCAASFGQTTTPYCDGFYQSRLSYLMASPETDHVVLTYRTENDDAQAAASLMDLANFLSTGGKSVILVLQAPILPSDVSSFLRQAIVSQELDVQSIKRSDWMQQNRHVYAERDRLGDGVAVVDLAEAFCDSETCYAIRDGKALFFDDDHMSLHGASIAAARVMRHLDGLAR